MLDKLTCVKRCAVPTVVLVVLNNIVVLPPVAGEVPTFGFGGVTLVLLSSVMVVTNVRLKRAGLSPRMLTGEGTRSRTTTTSRTTLRTRRTTRDTSHTTRRRTTSGTTRRGTRSRTTITARGRVTSVGTVVLGSYGLDSVPHSSGGRVTGTSRGGFCTT